MGSSMSKYLSSLYSTVFAKPRSSAASSTKESNNNRKGRRILGQHCQTLKTMFGRLGVHSQSHTNFLLKVNWWTVFEEIFLVQAMKVSQKMLLRRMFIVKVVFSSFVQDLLRPTCYVLRSSIPISV